MIKGAVNAKREAFVEVEIILADEENVVQPALIDTGFSGFLSLPPDTISELELPFVEEKIFVLANQREEQISLYQAVILWDGEKRLVLVAATGIPLIGMALLEGFRLTVDVTDGGAVLIEKRDEAGGSGSVN